MILNVPHNPPSTLRRARAAWFELQAATLNPGLPRDVQAELDRYGAALTALGLEVLLLSLSQGGDPPEWDQDPDARPAPDARPPVKAEETKTPEAKTPEAKTPETKTPEAKPAETVFLYPPKVGSAIPAAERGAKLRSKGFPAAKILSRPGERPPEPEVGGFDDLTLEEIKVVPAAPSSAAPVPASAAAPLPEVRSSKEAVTLLRREAQRLTLEDMLRITPEELEAQMAAICASRAWSFLPKDLGQALIEFLVASVRSLEEPPRLWEFPWLVSCLKELRSLFRQRFAEVGQPSPQGTKPAHAPKPHLTWTARAEALRPAALEAPFMPATLLPKHGVGSAAPWRDDAPSLSHLQTLRAQLLELTPSVAVRMGPARWAEAMGLLCGDPLWVKISRPDALQLLEYLIAVSRHVGEPPRSRDAFLENLALREIRTTFLRVYADGHQPPIYGLKPKHVPDPLPTWGESAWVLHARLMQRQKTQVFQPELTPPAEGVAPAPLPAEGPITTVPTEAEEAVEVEEAVVAPPPQEVEVPAEAPRAEEAGAPPSPQEEAPPQQEEAPAPPVKKSPPVKKNPVDLSGLILGSRAPNPWASEAAASSVGMEAAHHVYRRLLSMRPEDVFQKGRAEWVKELVQFCADPSWAWVPRDEAPEMLEYLIALSRSADEGPNGPDPALQSLALQTIKGLGARFKNPRAGTGVTGETYPMPYLHGMQTRHKPKIGSTWTEYALALRERQLPQSGEAAAPAEVKPKAKRKVKGVPPSTEVPSKDDAELEELDAELEARLAVLRPLTSGKKWVVVGGAARPDKLSLWRKLFQLEDIEWLTVSRATASPRRAASMSAMLSNGTLDGVLMLSFCSHSLSNAIMSAASKGSTPVFVVKQGYGLRKVLEAVERHLLTPRA